MSGELVRVGEPGALAGHTSIALPRLIVDAGPAAAERFLEFFASLHVAAYIRTHRGAVPTVKQHLAAIRVLCDWLVVSQVLPTNPAAAVRGPKHVVNDSRHSMRADRLNGFRDGRVGSVGCFAHAESRNPQKFHSHLPDGFCESTAGAVEAPFFPERCPAT